MKREREGDAALTLGILEAIATDQSVTQRHIARDLGVALGLTNSYLRRCVRKGLVKIKQAPANRYAYYLTPQGFAEKGRLTAEYLATSLEYYHRAGASLRTTLRAVLDRGARRVLLLGMSELAEIAAIRAHDFDLEIVGTFEAGTTLERFAGRPAWGVFEAVAAYDAALFTDTSGAAHNRAALHAVAARGCLFVPDVLAAIADPGQPLPDATAAQGGVVALSGDNV